MLNLIVKDLLVTKKVIPLALIYTVVFMLIFQFNGSSALTSAVIIAATYVLVNYSCVYEDKNKSEVFLNCMPIRRFDIVLGRYLSIFVFGGISVAFYWGASKLMNLSGLPFHIKPLTIEDIFGAIFAIVCMNSIYFPVLFKVGFVKAKFVNFILFFGFFFGVSAIISLVKQWSQEESVQKMLAFFQSLSDVQIISMLVVVMLVVLMGSFSLSYRFFADGNFSATGDGSRMSQKYLRHSRTVPCRIKPPRKPLAPK